MDRHSHLIQLLTLFRYSWMFSSLLDSLSLKIV
ncbi:hypothetical protein Patl1_20417 [Pistacia atlantica]|uniref:Uncharacterized protein n=1 Tax=Pistacia atlantica TaxID=434234 RepID=A0ACC1BHK8_9ROSI|nr:hypothetical protein Patl1_20417 [Pistacia atlantica]